MTCTPPTRRKSTIFSLFESTGEEEVESAWKTCYDHEEFTRTDRSSGSETAKAVLQGNERHIELNKLRKTTSLCPGVQGRSFNRPLPLLVSLLALLLLTAGCAREPEEKGAPVTVAVSIAPQAYLVERIGAPHIKALTLVQPGQSPHSYQPSDSQVSRVMQSRVYLKMGVPFERGKWFKAIEQSGKEIPVTDMREGISLRKIDAPCKEDHDAQDHAHCGDEACGEEHAHEGTDAYSEEGHAHEGLDPHIWLAPALLKKQARTVARTLQELDPVHRGEFEANLATLLDDLDRLDEEIKEILAPFAGKSLFLYHPAWGYFCDAYAIEQVAIEFEGKEPSDEELTGLQKRLRSEDAKVIFVQPQIAGSSARAIAEVLDVEIRMLDPLVRDVIENLRTVAKTIAASYE
jgi:zinc transport system substrate-binding protein